MILFLWQATFGYWFKPWESPYLRWRIETYWGLPAEHITKDEFLRFLWDHRWELLRFLRWVSVNR